MWLSIFSLFFVWVKSSSLYSLFFKFMKTEINIHEKNHCLAAYIPHDWSPFDQTMDEDEFKVKHSNAYTSIWADWLQTEILMM